MFLINEIRSRGFKIQKANMMQCYSFSTGSYRPLFKSSDGKDKLGDKRSVDWAEEWQSISHLESSGYKGMNFLGLDL